MPLDAQAQQRLFSGDEQVSSVSVAPSYVAQQWTIEDGLPVNAINDMVQTEDGYLWLATFDGLVRFDGVDFTVYQSGQYDGLPSSRILKLYSDDNDLWLHTESKALVHKQGDQFRVVDLPDVYDVFRTRNGTLWVSTQRGVYRQTVGRTFERVAEKVQDVVTTLHQTEDGTLWMGTSTNGVYRYEPNGTLTHITEADGLADPDVIAIDSTPAGAVLLGSWGGLQRWEDEALTWVEADDTPITRPVFQIETDTEGAVWLRTDEYVYRYRDGTAEQSLYRAVRTTFRPQGSLFANKTSGGERWINAGESLWVGGTEAFAVPAGISQLLYDHEQSLWVATQGEGLFQVRPSQMEVYGAPEGIGTGNVYSIMQRQDESIWIGTLGGGVTRMTPQDTTTYMLRKDTTTLDNVWAMHETDDGTLWLGGNRLCRWNNGQCAQPDDEGPIIGKRVLAIHEDQQGYLWVGTTDGLYRRSPTEATRSTRAWVRYVPENSNLPHRIVRSIRETPEGTLWFGTNGGGLALFHEGAFMAFTTEDGLPSNLVRPVYQDAEGVFWVGTEDRGLARIAFPDDRPLAEALEAASITTYTKRTGLFDNGIHHIEEDEQGRMWMSTNRGIFWVRKDELNAVAAGTRSTVTSTSYTERDGMRNREANGGHQPSGMRDAEGRLWFATQEGAVAFDPDTIHENEVPPPVHIERVVTEDSTYTLHDTSEISLVSDERNFDIDYTALSFIDPENVDFEYQLQGFDTEWRETEGRTATYTNVPPGTYTFMVRASNNDGVWNDSEARLTLNVAPHFYETWWFWLAIGLFGVAVLFIAYRMRMRALEQREQELSQKVEARTATIRAEEKKTQEALATVMKQAEQLEQIDASRTRFFSHVSHEFRTPLTLMLGPINALLKHAADTLSDEEKQQLRMARRSAQRLTQLVDQLHDLAKVETGTMSVQAEYDDIVAVVKEGVHSFDSLAMQHNITLVWRDGLGTHMMAFDAAKVEKIVANLLANAFEATDNGGTIRATLKAATEETDASERGVALTVEDTGVGIPPEQQTYLQQHFDRETSTWTLGNPRLGIGLNLVHELTRLHGGWVDFDSAEGRGTRFTVYLMHQPDHVNEKDGSVGADNTKPHESSKSTATTIARAHDIEPDAPEPDAPEGESETSSRDELPSEAPPDEGDDRPVILVIDDDDDFRTYIRWHLAPDYRVEEAAGGHPGYEAAQRILPDLVLLDVMMPTLDGFELCTMIKEHPDIDHIPIIMLTARADAESRVHGLDVGADAYLTKPFDTDELEVRIENLLASRRTLQRAFQRRNGAEAPLDHEGSDARPNPDAEPELVESVETCIARCFTDPDFGPTELAEAVALSPSHLRRKMKEHYDRTPVQLIRYRRLQAGAKLLRDEPDTTIGEVAYAVGFNSQSYFTRSFRDVFGQTPSEYRASEVS